MQSVGTPLLWSIFGIIVALMLAIDLFSQNRRSHTAHPMSFKHAALWSLVWVCVSLLFAGGLWLYLKSHTSETIATQQTLAFLTGYLLEKALAVDNVFVWLMLFSFFSIPSHLQQRVLVYGVLGAIILRTMMIFAGSWLVNEVSWILYLFGAFLVITGLKMGLTQDDHQAAGNSPLIRWLRGKMRVTESLHGERFFVMQQGIRYATPLFFVLILVELSDVIFAVDSIPAIFAVTTDPFIVLTSNLFAILGLRAMYFLLSGVADKFTLLKYGLAIILVFIGIKMLLLEVWHIPTLLSLGIIATILIATLLVNLWWNKRHH